jgi:hypothetical protein
MYLARFEVLTVTLLKILAFTFLISRGLVEGGNVSACCDV